MSGCGRRDVLAEGPEKRSRATKNVTGMAGPRIGMTSCPFLKP
jgi:hypothetical protein